MYERLSFVSKATPLTKGVFYPFENPHKVLPLEPRLPFIPVSRGRVFWQDFYIINRLH